MSTNEKGDTRRRILNSGVPGEALWSSNSRPARAGASAIVMVLLLLVGLAGMEVRSYRRQALEREAGMIADQVANHLMSWTDGRLAAIQPFVERWNDHYAGKPEVFRRDAQLFLDRLPGLQALNWLGPDWVIRTTVPNEGNEAALGRNLHDHPAPDVSEAIRRATETGAPARSRAIVDFLQGGRGFASYWPVKGTDGAVVGFVNAVFRIDRMVEVSRVAYQLKGEYEIALVEEDGLVAFAPTGEEDRGLKPWPFSKERKIALLDRPLVLVVAPTPSRVDQLVTSSDFLNLAGVLGACGLVGILAFGVLRRQSELNRLAMATDQAEEGILVIGRNARILYANDAASQMMGRNSLVGSDVTILSEGQGDDDLMVEIAESLGTGRMWRGRYSSVWADGSCHFRDASITPVRGRAGRVESYVGVIRDVTRENELEEELRHSQKMDAVGRLAGGAAHEFNNLLTVIQGYAEQLVESLDGESELHGAAATIQDAARRAAITVGQLLAFSRRQAAQPERLDLNAAVERLEMVLRGALGAEATLATRLGPTLPPVMADPNHIQQVLVNLCVNARDAMPEGGTVTLSTEEVVVSDGPSGTFPDLAPGRYAALSVSDHGSGMDEETRSRMFEPFFTTKEVGRGTGLGLATVYGIAEQSGGALRVVTEPGKGTVVTLVLPFAA
ncbi:MAG: PAS domain S-box protein [bacterium]|nr:PAS domain S-box protein [bacterium]